MLVLYLVFLVTALYYVSKILGPELSKTSVSSSSGAEKASEKLEILIIEKNKHINLIQKELLALRTQVRDFNKIKTLMEEEVSRLREQNRIFRSELGLPAASQKENSVK